MDRAEIHELSAAYALDALDPADVEAYEEHLSRCAECQQAVAAFQEAAAELAFDAEAAAPPPELRSRILAVAGRERSESADVIPFPRRRWLFPVAAAAAVAAGCLALGLAFWAADLSRQLDDREAAIHSSEEAIAALAEPGTTRIPLDGAEGVLLVNEETGEGWLVVRSLEDAPEEMTYEAWVIQDEEAVPAGLFAGGGLSTVVPLTAPVPEGALVAVTVEQAGGVQQSTQDPVFVTSRST
ncbi:MAG: anti-sigma factor domain-containing protein [Gaiellaceae bacterium]